MPLLLYALAAKRIHLIDRSRSAAHQENNQANPGPPQPSVTPWQTSISPLSCETDRVVSGSAGVGALGARVVTVQASFGCCCRRRYAGFRIVPVAAKSQATESTAGGLARVPPTRCLKPWAHLGAESTVRSVTLHPSVGSAPSHGGLAPLEPAVASLGVPSERAHRTQQRVPSQTRMATRV